MTLITATKLLTNAHIGVDKSRKLHEFLSAEGCPPVQNGSARGTFYQEAKASMLMPKFAELVRAGAQRKSTVGKAQRSHARRKPEGLKMLLVFELGNNESLTVTSEKAEALWKQLDRIFGGK